MIGLCCTSIHKNFNLPCWLKHPATDFVIDEGWREAVWRSATVARPVLRRPGPVSHSRPRLWIWQQFSVASDRDENQADRLINALTLGLNKNNIIFWECEKHLLLSSNFLKWVQTIFHSQVETIGKITVRIRILFGPDRFSRSGNVRLSFSVLHLTVTRHRIRSE